MRREIPPADLVFIDEGHKIFSFYGKWFTDPAWKDVPFIGLSATPWAKGLGRLYQELIIAATTQDLIDLGYLSKFRVFAPAHPDLKGVRTVAGDYHEGDLGTAMDKAPLVADIVSTWRKHGVGRPTLCFAVNRLHAQHIRDKFEEAGIRCGYVDCFSTPSERIEVRTKFASGEFRWSAMSACSRWALIGTSAASFSPVRLNLKCCSCRSSAVAYDRRKTRIIV